MGFFKKDVSRRSEKEDNEMGMVRESEDMQEEIHEMLTEAGKVPLVSTHVNSTTELSVCIRPFCYDVVLGGKNLLSFNHPENAFTVYRVMLADLKGNIYDV